MTFDPTKTPGAFGGAPAGAPHETTDGTVPTDVKFVSADGQVVSAVAMARANERDLPVYAPKPMSDEQAAAYLGLTVAEVQAKRAAAGTPAVPTAAVMKSIGEQVDAPAAAAPTIILTDMPAAPAVPRRRIANAPAVAPPTPIEAVKGGDAVAGATESVHTDASLVQAIAGGSASGQQPAAPAATLAAAVEAIHPRQAGARPDVNEPYYPARSDSDSPSRGIPAATIDQGKQITGGFGDVGEAQYFPMTGLEAGKTGTLLLQALIGRIPNDLRFSIALTYPRVRIRAVLEVECYASDGSFMIEKIMVPPHEKTPLDIARRHGDRCCFCVIEERIEMDDDGNSVTPPNAMRQEIGAPIPRKHAVPLPGGVGRLLVDVDS